MEPPARIRVDVGARACTARERHDRRRDGHDRWIDADSCRPATQRAGLDVHVHDILIDGQRRGFRGVIVGEIVPRPTRRVRRAVVARRIDQNRSANMFDPRLGDRERQVIDIARRQKRIAATMHDERTPQDAAVGDAGKIGDACEGRRRAKTIIFAEFFECRAAHQQFEGRSRLKLVVRVARVERRAGPRIACQDADMCAAQRRRAGEQRVEIVLQRRRFVRRPRIADGARRDDRRTRRGRPRRRGLRAGRLRKDNSKKCKR